MGCRSSRSLANGRAGRVWDERRSDPIRRKPDSGAHAVAAASAPTVRSGIMARKRSRLTSRKWMIHHPLPVDWINLGLNIQQLERVHSVRHIPHQSEPSCGRVLFGKWWRSGLKICSPPLRGQRYLVMSDAGGRWTSSVRRMAEPAPCNSFRQQPATSMPHGSCSRRELASPGHSFAGFPEICPSRLLRCHATAPLVRVVTSSLLRIHSGTSTCGNTSKS